MNEEVTYVIASQIAVFMGPTWGPPGSCRPQMGPMLAPWILLPGSSRWIRSCVCKVFSHWLKPCCENENTGHGLEANCVVGISSHIYIYIYIYNITDSYYNLPVVYISDEISMRLCFKNDVNKFFNIIFIDFMDAVQNYCSGDGHLFLTWWRHQMETFSASLAICAGNSPVPGEFPAQRPVTRNFDVFLICPRINCVIWDATAPIMTSLLWIVWYAAPFSNQNSMNMFCWNFKQLKFAFSHQ